MRSVAIVVRAQSIRDLAEPRDLRATAAEEAERRKPLQHIEKMATEQLERLPTLARAVLGGSPDQRGEHRDERQGHERGSPPTPSRR